MNERTITHFGSPNYQVNITAIPERKQSVCKIQIWVLFLRSNSKNYGQLEFQLLVLLRCRLEMMLQQL